jgi:hypothetical protein
LRRCALTVLLLGACSSGTEHMRSDWEQENAARLAREGDDAALVTPPRYPMAENLLEFTVPSVRDFRFYVDAASVSVNEGVVRYVLVGRSAAGAENVVYEGLNCRAAEYKLYAIGRGPGRWETQQVPWRPVGQRPAQRALMADFFCPRRTVIASAAEGVTALRRGGHPLADQPNPVSGR